MLLSSHSSCRLLTMSLEASMLLVTVSHTQVYGRERIYQGLTDFPGSKKFPYHLQIVRESGDGTLTNICGATLLTSKYRSVSWMNNLFHTTHIVESLLLLHTVSLTKPMPCGDTRTPHQTQRFLCTVASTTGANLRVGRKISAT